MPRGDNPNSRANLRPFEKGLPEENQRKVQRKGSKAGVETRQMRKTLTDTLKDKITQQDLDQITDMLIKRTKQGNLKALELLRDQIGEKPVEHIEQTNVDIAVKFDE